MRAAHVARRTRAIVLTCALLATLGAGAGTSALAQGAPIAGTFADERVTLSLRAIGGGQYTGTIAIDGATYQLSATGSGERVEGTFVVGGSSFAFQAEVVGDQVTLVSGASRYALQRRSESAQPQPPATDGAATAQRAVQRGTRLSYDHAAVSHPGTNAGPDARGVGGRGVSQFTVLHLDDRTCVLNLTMFLQAADGGNVMTLQPFSGGTVVSRDGTCPDVWWPPERLASYAAAPGSVERVERGPFQLASGGHTYDALYVRQEVGDTRTARAFDVTSGVVLSATDGTGPVQAPAPGPTSSSSMMLRDVRTPTYPWDVHAPLPANLQGLAGLSVSGTVSRSFVGVGQPPHVERFEGTLDVIERYPDLLLLRARGGGDESHAVLGAFADLYVPPTAIAQLRPGQRIDEDPVVGSVFGVERVDGGTLVLAVDGPGLSIRRTFDATTGLLRSERLETNDGITHTVIETTVTAIR